MDNQDNWRPLEISPADTGTQATEEGLVRYLGGTDLSRMLSEHKAIVLRGFAITAETLGPVLDQLLPNRLAYLHGNSPRTKVGQNLYTSTEYPSEFTISMHNELSYAYAWPTRLAFFCAQAPATGGATPVVDGSLWLASLDEEVRTAFAGGVQYIQNLHSGYGMGKSWQDTFETDNPTKVEEFLSATDATWEWGADDTLRIRQLRPATIRHPLTGAEVWFNQADQWHLAGLGEEAAELAELFEEDELPQSVRFADGSPIPDAYIHQIQRIGLDRAVDVDWAEGDLLLIDNLLVGHGRRPYTGQRRVLVAMSN